MTARFPAEQIQVLDNTDVFYDTDLFPGPSNPTRGAQLNDYVVRVKPDRMRDAARRAPRPNSTGKIKVPVLTMHNLGDLFVPFHMETEYRATVDAAGNGDLLVQRAIRGVGHCGFTTGRVRDGVRRPRRLGRGRREAGGRRRG